MEETKTKTHRTMSKNTLAKIILAVVVIALVAIAGWSYKKNNTPEKRQMAQANLLMKNIGKHQLLPNEKPIIATINEADKLIAEQPFYANVQNGDKLVIFPVAQKAIIYSPKLDVIVNSGPFVLDNKTPAK